MVLIGGRHLPEAYFLMIAAPQPTVRAEHADTVIQTPADGVTPMKKRKVAKQAQTTAQAEIRYHEHCALKTVAD